MVGCLYPNEEGVFGWESEGAAKWKPTDDAIAEFINNHHEEIDVIVINK